MLYPPSSLYPPLAAGQTVYAVGDIHGCDHLLKDIHARIDRDGPPGVEVYLGDFIDRGPDSPAVIDRLIDRAMTRQSIFIRGNHEFLLQEFYAGKIDYAAWHNVGAVETLRAYGIDIREHNPFGDELRTAFAERLPSAHRAFFDDLRQSFTVGDYFFTHAGVRPGVALDAQTSEDLMWIRREFLASSDPFGKIVVHGHTPTEMPEFKPNRINIDTGAFATGRLTCLVLDGDGARLLG